MIGKLLIMMFLVGGSSSQPSWAEDALRNTLANDVLLAASVDSASESSSLEQVSTEPKEANKPQDLSAGAAAGSMPADASLPEPTVDFAQVKPSSVNSDISIEEYTRRLKEINKETSKAIADYNEKKSAFEKDLLKKLNKFGKTEEAEIAKTRMMDEAIAIRKKMLEEHRQKMDLIEERRLALRVARFGRQATSSRKNELDRERASMRALSERIRMQDGKWTPSAETGKPPVAAGRPPNPGPSPQIPSAPVAPSSNSPSRGGPAPGAASSNTPQPAYGVTGPRPIPRSAPPGN